MYDFLKLWQQCAEIMALAMCMDAQNRSLDTSTKYLHSHANSFQFLIEAGLLISKGGSSTYGVLFVIPSEGWAHDYYFHDDDSPFPSHVSPYTINKRNIEEFLKLQKYPLSEASLQLQQVIVTEISHAFNWQTALRLIEQHNPEFYKKVMTFI